MDLIDTDEAEGFFTVVAGTERSDAATMILESGQSTGGPSNRHPDSDQWLYVKAGTGEVTLEGETHEIGPGDLLLIEAGETHEIANGGEDDLETVSVYAPAEYT
ncbi:cupin domain-containing protein [Saliphagus sp. LR7]|uniref:cupin domain-containing protein n=1 Tax=Saliphagus sp. LR7 TaxID=2282654 RepID=UPI000DF76D3B|nr:cupin domain-containing protein [Saliphagus sp. LR7]